MMQRPSVQLLNNVVESRTRDKYNEQGESNGKSCSCWVPRRPVGGSCWAMKMVSCGGAAGPSQARLFTCTLSYVHAMKQPGLCPVRDLVLAPASGL